MSKTFWERDEQTEGKHLILSRYLDRWFPILGRWNGRLLFIDGFAGPRRIQGWRAGVTTSSVGVHQATQARKQLTRR